MAGVAAGVALGILFAPHKGSKTRRNIMEKGEDLAEALNDRIDKRFQELVGTVAGKVMKGKPANGSVPVES